MHTKIRELRQARGWSMRELAGRVNSTSSTINKLEKGQIKIDIAWVKKLSDAFGIPISALMSEHNRDKISFRSDVALYDGDLDSAFPEIKFERKHSVYMAISSSLDQLGILPQHFLLVDQSIHTPQEFEIGDIVVFQLFDSEMASEFATLMREFVPPSILITNTSKDDQQIINFKDKKIKFIGVATSHLSARRGKFAAGRIQEKLTHDT